MTRLVLREHTGVQIDLPARDIELLHGRLNKQFQVRPAMNGNGFLVNPGSTVGVIRLPSGTQLEILPKVPLRNLLWMLSDVHGISFESLLDQVEINRFDEIIEIVADAFSQMVERRIDHGLYRNYVEEEANLPNVRGRIMVAQDVHHNAILRHRTFCRYTTYSWDLPENQVIRHVAHLLSGWGLSRKLTGRLLALDQQLDEISRIRFRAQDVDQFAYNRQSEDYHPIHRLCQFFLEGASLSEEEGNIAFDGFLINMNTLFEKLITKALRERMPRSLLLEDQMRTTLDHSNAVHMRPDLVISENHRPAIVADCKYKMLTTGEHRHHDLYQLLAYCTALRVANVVLVYPRHLVDIDSENAIRGSDVRIREVSVDLSGTADAILAQFDILASLLLSRKSPKMAMAS